MAVSSAWEARGEGVEGDSGGNATPREVRGVGADPRTGGLLAREDRAPDGRRIEKAVLAFVALGVLLRVGRYLVNYPVWGDEACLASEPSSSRLSRPAVAPGIWADLPHPLPLGRADGRETVRLLGDFVAAVPLDLRHRERLSVPPRSWPVAGRTVAASWPWRSSPSRSIRSGTVPRPSPMQPTCWWPWPCWPWRSSGIGRPNGPVGSGCWPDSPRSPWQLRIRPYSSRGGSRWPWYLPSGGCDEAGQRLRFAAYVLTIAASFAILFVGYMHRQQNSGASLAGLQRYWADSFPRSTRPCGWRNG